MNASNFITFTKVFNAYEWAKENAPETTTSFYGNENEGIDDNSLRFRKNISSGIQKAKIFEVDEGIKKLLCLTDTPINNEGIHLPFEKVFLDVSFSKKELKDLGIEINADEIMGILTGEGEMISEEGIKVGTDLNICMLSKQENGEYWFDDFNKNINLKEEYQKYSTKINECKTTDKKARDFSHKFLLNFLNFLNNPEVEFVEHKRSEKNQERRIKQGKSIIPSTMTIKVSGKLKEYIDEAIKNTSWTYGYRFWVRGHFRDLQSDRYIQKKRIWILPYIKGKGVLVEKTYVVGRKNEN